MAAHTASTLQDMFLTYLRDNKVEVTMFLVNGIKLQGHIAWFDSFTVQLVRGNSSQLVYKHAISAIDPAEPVRLTVPTDER